MIRASPVTDRREAAMKKLYALALVAITALATAAQSPAQGPIEWRVWSGDHAQTRYSIAADITPSNVQQLKQAWDWTSKEMPNQEYGSRPGGFEATPLMIDDVLYFSTPFHRAVALNAETGAELWVFDPEAWKGREDNIGFKHRGLAYWGAGDEARIFLNTDARLFALDGKSGKPVTSFGQDGVASLTDLVRPVKPRHTSQTSPPVVYKNLVIVGSRVPDRLEYKGDTPGTVQAFDVRTGKRAWIFYTIPQSAKDPGADTWDK